MQNWQRDQVLLDKFDEVVQKKIEWGMYTVWDKNHPDAHSDKSWKYRNHDGDSLVCPQYRKYTLRFAGKIGEKPEYTGCILAVGISYNKADPGKRHECKVEVLREKL